MLPLKKRRRFTPIYRESGYIKRLKPISSTEKLIWGICLCILLPVSLLALFTARFNGGVWVEKYFSLGFYPVWVKIVSALTKWASFSVAEIGLYLFIAAVIAIVVNFISRLVKYTTNRGTLTYRFTMRTLSVLSVILMLFTISCGLNYYRTEFAEYSGLTIRESEINELAALCGDLAETANRQRKNLPEDQIGVSTYAPLTSEELSDRINDSYQNLLEENAQWQKILGLCTQIPVKPIFFSQGMSYMQLVGVFCPYTMEANVNIHTTDFDIPSAMAHELAHVAGFMREDEANFIAYLACRSSDDSFINYSGTMLAFIHSTNALYSKNTEMYSAVMSKLSDKVLLDLQVDSEYYAKYDTSFGKLSNKVNDVYLKINNQQDGVASYGRMVDLLLADYRERKS